MSAIFSVDYSLSRFVMLQINEYDDDDDDDDRSYGACMCIFAL